MDGACNGCGEKTCIHLVVAAVEASLQPRVAVFIDELAAIMKRLDEKIRIILASGTDLDALVKKGLDHVDVEIDEEKREHLNRLTNLLKELKDLHWRYTSGPTGNGRAALAMTNSTGCSSVWASTYPYNPYPFPWVNHLFQDAPSVAVGIFEGQMRKMKDAFTTIRKTQLELDDAYDASTHDNFFAYFDWRQFTDEEFKLCPPVFATGGDGAMFDIGFQNLSRLLASGKPVRVIVLDTQVYSNTGGQACTSGFISQVSDMAAYGRVQHGKEEDRKEISLLAVAHRGCFVVQTSQASTSHLLSSVLKGLNSKRPAIFTFYTPCQTEHIIGDDASEHAAKLALEGRAFPYMVYDPDAGDSMAERLDLSGNPEASADWPTYTLDYTNADGESESKELPMTTADWAATEGRFRKHFKIINPDKVKGELTLLSEYLELDEAGREGKDPFIYGLSKKNELQQMSIAPEMVTLCETRIALWRELQEMAGLRVSDIVRDTITEQLEDQVEAQLQAIRDEYEAKISNLKSEYPKIFARRLADMLLSGDDSVAAPVKTTAKPVVVTAAAPAVEATTGSVDEDDDDDIITDGPYIDTELCTTCDECTAINSKMFVYNDKKKAYIADASAGNYRQLVEAAERCPAEIIHPGTPLNAKERDLEKWVKRAQPFI